MDFIYICWKNSECVAVISFVTWVIFSIPTPDKGEVWGRLGQAIFDLIASGAFWVMVVSVLVFLLQKISSKSK